MCVASSHRGFSCSQTRQIGVPGVTLVGAFLDWHCDGTLLLLWVITVVCSEILQPLSIGVTRCLFLLHTSILQAYLGQSARVCDLLIWVWFTGLSVAWYLSTNCDQLLISTFRLWPTAPCSKWSECQTIQRSLSGKLKSVWLSHVHLNNNKNYLMALPSGSH